MITWHIHHSRNIIDKFKELYVESPDKAWEYLREILPKQSAKIRHMVMDKLSDYKTAKA